MEIITYVRKGTILHKDSLGHEGRTGAGDVQVMSAGRGIRHAEHSDPAEDTVLFQIWIHPREYGIDPRWDQKAFPKTPVNENLNLLVSGRAEDDGKGALLIHQDAASYGGRMSAGTTLTHRV
jgi:redox-sensitive bicupin YhaK (pirin superfamily)